MDVPNTNDNTSLLRGRGSLPEVTVSLRGSSNSVPRWMEVLPWVVASLIVAIIGSYCSLEIYRLTTIHNNTTCGVAYTISNSISSCYLSLVFIVTVYQLVYCVKNNNGLSDSKFRNYPMLMIMIICGCIDVSYYTMQLLRFISQQYLLIPMLSTVAEFIFGVVILPFVILCVCYKVTPGYPRMKIYIATTMGLCISGCVMVFVKRVTSKIMIRFNVTCVIVTEEYRFMHDKVDHAANNLILVDITYILIGLVFLVYLFVQLRQEDLESDDRNSQDPITADFLTSISFARYRWATLVGCTMLVMVYLCSSYIISEVANSQQPRSFKDNCQIIFLSITMAMYIACIAYFLVYHFTNHSSMQCHGQQFIKIDGYFSTFTAINQAMFGVSMFAFYLWIYDGSTIPTVYRVRMTLFVLQVVQVVTQLWYINSVIENTVPIGNVSYWKSVLFPPVALALFNFGFLMHNIVYPGSSGFLPSGDSTQQLVYSILNDFLSPVAMLNRLHGLAFFINLSIQQWRDN